MPGSRYGDLGSRGDVTLVQTLERDDICPGTEDLFVKAITVQGGEAHIAGEKTSFARIVMTGVDLKHLRLDDIVPRRQESAVLSLDAASALVAELHGVVNEMVRSSRTPAVPATGTWSWSSAPPHAEELYVAQANANAVPVTAGVRPTVRVDFTGTLVRGLCLAEPPLCAKGAIFSGPRQVQALISSLKKVVNSALEKRRLDIYVSADAPLSAYGF
jgi:hypothetical protein